MHSSEGYQLVKTIYNVSFQEKNTPKIIYFNWRSVEGRREEETSQKPADRELFGPLQVTYLVYEGQMLWLHRSL